MASFLPTGLIRLAFRPLGILLALFAASLSVAVQADQPVLAIDTGKANPTVAGNRLETFLGKAQCPLEVVFGDESGAAFLEFRVGAPSDDSQLVLAAVNRHSQLPRPVWVTRRTAGVRSLGELAGRDLSIVTGEDPLGAAIPLAALHQAGVNPSSGQLYGAGDYSSALGLLLHNNTHASVSESGFLQPFREKNDLVVSWKGNASVQAGWYRGPRWSSAFRTCEQALSTLRREDDRQKFTVFPGWVFGFVPPGQIHSEDGVQ